MIEQPFQPTQEQLEQAQVLVVDDDELVTASLASFLSLEVEIEPIVFNQSTEAMAYVCENDIDLIISDFLMPRMNGIELLTEVRRIRPDAPRVLLTGYADKANAVRAINEAGVFHYLEKPWDNLHLQQIVVDGLTRRLLAQTLKRTMDQLGGDQPELARLTSALCALN